MFSTKLYITPNASFFPSLISLFLRTLPVHGRTGKAQINCHKHLAAALLNQAAAANFVVTVTVLCHGSINYQLKESVTCCAIT